MKTLLNDFKEYIKRNKKIDSDYEFTTIDDMNIINLIKEVSSKKGSEVVYHQWVAEQFIYRK